MHLDVDIAGESLWNRLSEFGIGASVTMSVVYYVSSHGLGHAARSVQVLREIPASVSLHVKSGVPEWFFWQEVQRSFTFMHDVFDCGSLEVEDKGIDRRVTLQAYSAIAGRNAARLDAEVEWLKSVGARCVVTDIASFPLRVAAEAGIPGLLVANFTWVNIYEPYLKDFPQFSSLISDMRGEYRLAQTAFVAPPNMPMPFLHKVQNVPLMARRGRVRRNEILHAYGLDASKSLALCYPENMEKFKWHRLGDFRDWIFLTFATMPGARPRNLVTLEQGRFSHPDVVASVDAVVAKAGYGMVGECMCNGKPMLYTGRDHFAEFDVLDQALAEWGGAIKIPQKDFKMGHWGDALESLLAIKPVMADRCDGGKEVAAGIMKFV